MLPLYRRGSKRNRAAAKAAEGQALLDIDLPFLTSGASGLPNHVIDTRILNVNHLPSGPFHLTPDLSYDDYAASPVHRFYQMWQQLDCSVKDAPPENPSGSRADLFALGNEQRRSLWN